MIIRSILDSDLYKFTMQQAVLHFFPSVRVRWKLTIRSKVKLPENFDNILFEEIQNMKTLSLTKEEENYLKTKMNGIFLLPYISFLKKYRFDPSQIIAIELTEEGDLNLIIEGLWVDTILWEVPLMAMISELYFIHTGQIVDINNSTIELRDKDKMAQFNQNDVVFNEFGTRRRYSFANQERVVKLFKEESLKNNYHVFKGTSNVYLAFKYDLDCKGTMAHEWFMVINAIYGYLKGNNIGIEYWHELYQGKLGIALTDTITSDEFFKTFSKEMAIAYDGTRHDSFDPFVYTDKVVKYYNDNGINPLEKIIIFSNNLNTQEAIDIRKYTQDKIQFSAGIGTFLTNDVGVKPLNMVIKISEVLVDGKWIGAVKLSDELTKNTGKLEDVNECKKQLNVL